MANRPDKIVLTGIIFKRNDCNVYYLPLKRDYSMGVVDCLVIDYSQSEYSLQIVNYQSYKLDFLMSRCKILMLKDLP